MNPHPIRYKMKLPPDFLKKEVNEQVVCDLLSRALGIRTSRRGDPRLREPDFILDGMGEEVTFAAEGAYPHTFIEEYCDGVYTPCEAHNAMTVPILAALDRKAAKNYCMKPVAVAVLCMLELFEWTQGGFGTEIGEMPHRERDAFFSIVRRLYIESGKFSNVHLIAPTLTGAWTVFDLAADIQYLVTAFDDETLPYFIAEEE